MHVVPRALTQLPLPPFILPPILSPSTPRVPLVAIFSAVSISSCSAVPRLINVPTDLYQPAADGSVQIHTRAVDPSINPSFEKRSEQRKPTKHLLVGPSLSENCVFLDTLGLQGTDPSALPSLLSVCDSVLTTNTADTKPVLHYRDLESRARPFPSSCRSSQNINNSPPVQPFADAQFDIFDWHPYFQSCVRYFLDHAQYEGPIQALAAFVNIQLPFQKSTNPVLSSRANSPSGGGPGLSAAGFAGPGSSSRAAAGAAGPGGAGLLGAFPSHISLLPYIRRLVATGFDFPAVLHGFFGDDWQRGIGQFHEQERRNYLFATKSNSWLDVKAAYDMGTEETIPFLKPLQNSTEKEIQAAEAAWSEWLAMQDWMVGPRGLAAMNNSPSGGHGRRGKPYIKREEN
ncbi:hypothetical protein QBC36DRAFT_345020 [Triangularia setosa]|uniref:Uncharacterized protein n=1 Tax=Triangularia setosa TaxID=2587417 RepID=A0AAN6W9K3_9PEZI|nr:hypothetical protein QBC36DRAFT_345020 [Podospora setosa]